MGSESDLRLWRLCQEQCDPGAQAPEENMYILCHYLSGTAKRLADAPVAPHAHKQGGRVNRGAGAYLYEVMGEWRGMSKPQKHAGGGNNLSHNNSRHSLGTYHALM